MYIGITTSIVSIVKFDIRIQDILSFQFTITFDPIFSIEILNPILDFNIQTKSSLYWPKSFKLFDVNGCSDVGNLSCRSSINQFTLKLIKVGKKSNGESYQLPLKHFLTKIYLQRDAPPKLTLSFFRCHISRYWELR